MHLTTHTDYALRLLIYLAAHGDGGPVSVSELAQRYRVSAHHMAKVAQTLVHHGWVQSARGRGGGLSLACEPRTLCIGAVVRKTENLVLLECFGPDSTCPIEPACRLKRVLGAAQEAFLKVLDEFTLADLVKNRRELLRLLEIDALEAP